MVEHKLTLGLLTENEWLAGLPSQATERLIQAAKVRRFKENQSVQAKGAPADGLYGVLSGEVRVSATSFAGDEIVFTRILPGQWFGEIALLDGGPRTHDAHALIESELAILPKKVVMDLCFSFPEVYRAMVLLLCGHCRQAFTAVDDLLVCSPEQRLARRLLQRSTDSKRLNIEISQQELGSLIGISRQSTNKILKSWESKGFIVRVYRGLEIINIDALRAVI
ncbi:MAG: Crp/Fnr family transcriptional regulator [Pseudomonadales bacterium]